VPTYDYQCRSCGHTIEVIHSMTEEGPSTCERCGGELRRVLYPTGIIFKGSGFYKTDSRSTGGSASDAKPATKATPKVDPGSTSAGDATSKPPPPSSAPQESAGS
jgi:putative FmdB family regulatory protein